MLKNTICKKIKKTVDSCEYNNSTQVNNMPFQRGYLVKLPSELIIWLRPALRPVEETISILTGLITIPLKLEVKNPFLNR